MWPDYELSPSNLHWEKQTPQGNFLHTLVDRIGQVPGVWYCDTMNMPHLHHLKKYFSGTLIIYCWWDPARDLLAQHLDEMDLRVILVTPDVDYAGVHAKQTVIPWQYQYGLHMDLIQPSRPARFTRGDRFLCMMRNHKSERIQFLQHLWSNGWLNNQISYLGQINTLDNGRESRTIESILRPQYFIDSEFTQCLEPKFEQWCVQNLPLSLPDDNTQNEERNTDFYTVGNIDWYDQTDYSVVLETYWAKTQFLTEKSFKPIIAQHPFINLGNNTAQLLKQLGFDIFDDVVNYTATNTPNRINQFQPVTFDIDPRRLANNLINMCELRQSALEEQRQLVARLEDSLTN